MDDDYFIGKPINKSSFFYYDEEQKKVLPNIVSDQYKILNKNYVNNEYKKNFAKRDRIEHILQMDGIFKLWQVINYF